MDILEERRAELDLLEHERKVAMIERWIADSRRQTAENEARATFAAATAADFAAWLEERRAAWEVRHDDRLD